MTTADDRARRSRVVDGARHGTELAGGRTDAETRALQERYVGGEITLDDLGERVRQPEHRAQQEQPLAGEPPACDPWRTGATDTDRWRGYFVPGTRVLRNVAGARDVGTLQLLEDRHVEWRTIEATERPPVGTFDTEHLLAVHRHLFQDVYPWAGTLRTVTTGKGEDVFVHHSVTEPALRAALDERRAEQVGPGVERAALVRETARLFAELHHVQPFRDGNGRTTRLFLGTLAGTAGYHLDWCRVDAAALVQVSRAAYRERYDPLLAMVDAITLPDRP